ncbi:MAG: VOC family protein [Defluviitaleaceae bacterium]|nr:VOC family protein [Defluviitaleaceae bacterium]
MRLDVFLNFDGDCREAINFYAEVFKVSAPNNIMTYGDAPGFTVADEHKNRVLYATLPIFGCNVMFSDCAPAASHIKGTNVALTISCADANEIARVYDALANSGTVHMPLGKTFFSELYGMITDKFAVTWQLSLSEHSSIHEI